MKPGHIRTGCGTRRCLGMEDDMIKETRTYYCDACGKEIKGYVGSINVVELDRDGYPSSVERDDFCEPCMKSFQEWLRSRREPPAMTREQMEECKKAVEPYIRKD